jgi:hypothetical protein
MMIFMWAVPLMRRPIPLRCAFYTRAVYGASTKKHAGKTVLICGHGDNLLPMIEYLNGKRPQESLGPHEYDKIFKVDYFKNSAVVTVIKY